MSAAILFIDDYEPASTIMQFIVEDMGHHFSYSSTGDDALMQVKEQHFDVALVDINLPKYDGHVLAQKLRAVSKNENICLVGYTADAKSVSNDRAQYFDVLEQKSLKAEETSRLIANALKRCNSIVA